MGFARAVWWVAVAILGLPFLDALPRALRNPPQWVTRATRTRAVLGILEAAAVVGWFVLLRGRIPIAEPGVVRTGLALAGALVAVAGGALAAWARLALGRWFSPNLGVQRDHDLVTTGPYALVRHPLYLGLIVFTIGSALVWNDGGLLVLSGVLAVLLGGHVPVEERLFAAHFGPAFESYRATTPALLPWPRPRRDGVPTL